MFRVLIVEDEPLERMALKTELEYGEYDIERIFEADNGRYALELFKLERPDIAIIDINIPVLSGLGLIEAISGEGHPCKILITTAYDKSEYIRKALSMGVVEYLLKPIDEHALRSAVEKCQSLLCAEQQKAERLNSIYTYSQKHLLRDCLQGRVPLKTLEKICEWPSDGDSQFCLLVWLPGGDGENNSSRHFPDLIRDILGESYYSLSAQIGEMSVTLVKAEAGESQDRVLATLRILSEILYRELTSKEIGCLFMSKPMTSFHCIQEYYTGICDQSHFRGQSRIIRPSMPCGGLCSPRERPRLRQKWINKLATREPAQITGSVKRKLMQPGAYWPGACLFVEAFMQMDGSADIADLLRCFGAIMPFRKLENFLANYFGESISGAGEIAPSNKLISTALDTLKSHYAQDLTQYEIAEQLGLNQSYFSTLFKKVTGDNFSNVLSTIRIQHAMEFIDAGEMDMDIVAAKCGYSNKKYFYEIFRKRTGSTITEYIKANGKR